MLYLHLAGAGIQPVLAGLGCTWAGQLGTAGKRHPTRFPQLLEAAWLLSVRGQRGTAKLPAFAVGGLGGDTGGEQAAMPWCSLPVGLMLRPRACTHSWLGVCPAPGQ